jgi:putative N-acetylmannosamine-6-phosphate epimerase
MAAMARAAVAGGAAGIRAESPADVAAVAAVVEVPVIGLRKVRTPGQAVYLTPTVADAQAVAAAGAHVVAVDATDRPRGAHPDGAGLVAAVVASIGVPVLADVDALGAGLRARAAGAAAVATTLAGLTEPGAPVPDGPDVELVAALAAELDCPVIAEGRYATPEHVRAAFAAGAWAVCAGAAITDPVALTRRLAGAVA